MRISGWSSDVCSSDLDDDEPDQICRRPFRRDDGVADRDPRALAAAAQGDLSARPCGLARRLRADATRSEDARCAADAARTEERRVGKERVSAGRCSWWGYH